MKKFQVALAIADILAGCGGGGSSDSTTPTSASTVAPVVTTPAVATLSPAVTTPASTVAAPVIAANVVNMPVSNAKTDLSGSGATIQQGDNALWNVTNATAALNLTMTGNNNKMWVAAPTAGGVATVNGTNNTFIFSPGTDPAINVTGTGNTFYLVQGSAINLTGPGVATSTIIYYNPT